MSHSTPYIPKRFWKDPDATKGYRWNWAQWLARRADTIASAVFTPVSGLTYGASSISAGVVTLQVSGGVIGEKYTIKCKITTNGIGPAGVLVEVRSIVVIIRAM